MELIGFLVAKGTVAKRYVPLYEAKMIDFSSTIEWTDEVGDGSRISSAAHTDNNADPIRG